MTVQQTCDFYHAYKHFEMQELEVDEIFDYTLVWAIHKAQEMILTTKNPTCKKYAREFIFKYTKGDTNK